ncbi:EntF family bacteriocin induction factor [Dellaglioa sp. BT-FLS60]
MELKDIQKKQLTKNELKLIKGGKKSADFGESAKNIGRCVISLFKKC